MLDLFHQSGADIVGEYRYRLWRQWDIGAPIVVWVMLNPSTADADDDDPTVRRCIGYARDWGAGGIEVVNMFALRATDPRQLLKHRDPVGPLNIEALTDATCGRYVVCAWGTGIAWFPWDALQVAFETIARGASEISVLGLTKAGHPKHPLYLPKYLDPQPWDVRRYRESFDRSSPKLVGERSP